MAGTNNMRTFRKAADLTVDQAAEKGDMKKSRWSVLENEKEEPSYKNLFQVSGVFGVAPVEVFPKLAEPVKQKTE